MSKKKIAAGLLLVLIAVFLDLSIFSYKFPISGKNVTVNIEMDSDRSNEIEVFYLKGQQSIEKDFSAEQSAKVIYENTGKKEVLSYKIPADISYLRLDFGKTASATRIYSIKVAYKDNETKILPELYQKIVKQQSISDISKGTELSIKSMDGDPYIVWNADLWNIEDFINDTGIAAGNTARIVICIIVDIIFLLGFLLSRRLASLPRELYQNRQLIVRLSKNDFKTKFAGSYLGIVWAFVQPIVTVLVYWFVFEKGLKAGGINTKAGIEVPFVLWLVAGIVPWFFFSDALCGGTNALIEYSYLVKKVVFKISILPIVKIISALFVHAFFVLFTVALFAAYGYFPDLYMLQIFYYSAAMIIFVLGVVYATCAIVIFFRDLSQIISIILQVGMWMTPIMWNIDAMNLSPVLLTIFKFNPMFYIVSGYRDALINKIWFWEHFGLTLYFWVITAIIFGVGTMIFKRLKIHFADVL